MILYYYYRYSLKDGSLKCEIRTCVIVYANLPTLECLDFVKFSHVRGRLCRINL